MQSIVRPALVMFMLLSIVCGVIYPFAITGIGKIAFPNQAAGGLVDRAGQPASSDKSIGSLLIGQAFSSPKYFWGRPSATSPMPNNATSSSGSNQGPLNPALVDAVKGRIDALKAADPTNTSAIPVDLVTASASGLDPEISVAAANYQAARVARERKVPIDGVMKAIDRIKTEPGLDFLGEPTVNVLALNIALDQASAR